MANSKKVNIQFSLPVSIFKEGKYFVAYTPILDLSTSGKSYEEVKKRFEEVVKIFFHELIEKGTLDKVLSDLGWQKVQKQWSPPTPIAHESVNFKLPVSP
jgi:predicted RNase H-like HicB family nuclease